MTEVWSGDTPLLHEVVRRAGKSLVPWQAALEVTHRCNLRCKHCYIDRELRQYPGDELSVPEWSEILDQLVAEGTLYLLFTGGEVLLRSDFLNIAFAAKERNFRIAILTNGTLVDAAVIAGLARLRPIAVGVSLYGATAPTHEAVTGCPGSFEASREAIVRLTQNDVPVVAQVTIMDGNIHEVGAIRTLVDSLGASLSMSHELVPTRGCSQSPLQFRPTYDAINRYLASDPLFRTLEPGLGPTTCQAGRAVCAISPYGEVLPCLMMPMLLGNLRDRSFRDIWWENPSDDLVSLRSLSRGDFESCDGCADAAFCERCPGVALAETGSLTGRPPSTCHSAATRAKLYSEMQGETSI